jgi:hypothetical protein
MNAMRAIKHWRGLSAGCSAPARLTGTSAIRSEAAKQAAHFSFCLTPEDAKKISRHAF